MTGMVGNRNRSNKSAWLVDLDGSAPLPKRLELEFGGFGVKGGTSQNSFGDLNEPRGTSGN